MKNLRKIIASVLAVVLILGNMGSTASAKELMFGKTAIDVSFPAYEKYYNGESTAENFPLDKAVIKAGKSIVDKSSLKIESADVNFSDASAGDNKVITITNIKWAGKKTYKYEKPETLTTTGEINARFGGTVYFDEPAVKYYDGTVKGTVKGIVEDGELLEADKDLGLVFNGEFNSPDVASADRFFIDRDYMYENVEASRGDNYFFIIRAGNSIKGKILPIAINGIEDKTVEYDHDQYGRKSFDIADFGSLPAGINGEWTVTKVTDNDGIIKGNPVVGTYSNKMIFDVNETEKGGTAEIELTFNPENRNYTGTKAVLTVISHEKEEQETTPEQEIKPVLRDVQVDYVDKDRNVISSEVLKIPNGTTRIAYTDLKEIPEGYEVYNKNDRNILDGTLSVKILVTKIGGEVTPETKPEIKPEPKPEPKPEVKPEVKPEPKPEPKPEVKPEVKPDTDTTVPETEDKEETAPSPESPVIPDEDQGTSGDEEMLPDTDKAEGNTTEEGTVEDLHKEDALQNSESDEKTATDKADRDGKAESEEDKAPQTDDASDAAGYMALMMIAASGALYFRRKYEK